MSTSQPLAPAPPAPGIDPDVLAQVSHGWTVEQWVSARPHVAYHVTRTLVSGWLRLSWRLRYYGANLVPAGGPILSCPTHSSWLDSWIQALCHRRLPRWMGKQEVIDAPVLGWYLRRGGVFPVARGKSDATAIDIGRLLLVSGQQVVVYPEGTRIRPPQGDALGSPRRGAARLALATGAPIQPVATYGLKPSTGRAHLRKGLRWLPLARRVTTVVGETFSMPVEEDPSPERVDEVRDEIWKHVEALYDIARTASLARTRPREVTLPGGRVVRATR